MCSILQSNIMALHTMHTRKPEIFTCKFCFLWYDNDDSELLSFSMSSNNPLSNGVCYLILYWILILIPRQGRDEELVLQRHRSKLVLIL